MATKAQQHRARMEELHSQGRATVAHGVCPDCGAPLKRNLSMNGWWQCSQYGSEAFRADPSKPSCSFQCFTD